MKVSLLQLNPVVGDLKGNSQKILEAVQVAETASPDLIVTSELALLGYPPRDLLLVKHFVRRSWEVINSLAQELEKAPPVLIGIAEPNPAPAGRPLYNATALVHKGKLQGCYRKTLLPSYDVFDEDRYFEPSTGSQILQAGDNKIGVSICEDIWNDQDFWKDRRYQIDPVQDLISAGANIIVNISASPFTVGKQQIRERMLGSIAQKHQVPILYVNQVGGDDDLIFDGRSCAFGCTGTLIARAAAFCEDILTVDLTGSTNNQITVDDVTPESEIWRALVLGTRDYVHKTGFKSVILGLSGGIDSALVAAIASEAVGKENVLGVMMPSPYSSRGSIEDSLTLVANLGIRSTILPIISVMNAFDEVLRQEFTGHSKDITEENLQARIRGTILMALSNKFGSLLLTTGNKSEISVGYCTLYGDMCGALGVISDVPKVMVYRLVHWWNQEKGYAVIPKDILTKAPSAELHPNQIDQDSLPPYEVLDEVLHQHVERYASSEEIIAKGYSVDTVFQVINLVRNAEFKRKQAAPGLKVTDRAFGTGWRMPIVAKKWCRE
jgi:NAD+ synthase/NAD+ synthase (glutamine-hydrolysing)